MPLSRRGLFGLLAGAPAAAVGMVALPAKGEPTTISTLLQIKIDDSDIRDFVRATIQHASSRAVRHAVRRHKADHQGEGDWRS